MDEKPAITTFGVCRIWSEIEFQYNEYVVNCTRSQIDPVALDDRPLSVLLSVRRF